MRHWRSILAGLVLAFLAGPGARAAVIAAFPLFDTGVLDSGARAGNGGIESHYTLVSSPSGALSSLRVVTSSNGPPVPPWVGDDALSAWIGPATDQVLTGPPGTYDYRLTFSLTGFVPYTAVITGQWAADDAGTNILINGVPTGDTASGFRSFTSFSVTSGFVYGLNTLDFIVTNVSSSTGLRVEMTGMAQVPEPGSLALLGMGLAVLSLWRMTSRAGSRVARGVGCPL